MSTLQFVLAFRHTVCGIKEGQDDPELHGEIEIDEYEHGTIPLKIIIFPEDVTLHL